MTYNVFSGMLNPTQSINQSIWTFFCVRPRIPVRFTPVAVTSWTCWQELVASRWIHRQLCRYKVA